MSEADGRCAFVATDGRQCILHQWHKAPRKRNGHYVTRGDIGDSHLLEGEQSCKWGDGPKVIAGETFTEDAMTQWSRESGTDPITGRRA